MGKKAAVLFAGGGRGGAILANTDKATENSLSLYGLHLGQAFQIFDDYLDYEGNTEDLGKNVGDDLAGGKLTLPLIEALRITTNTKENTVLRQIIEEKDVSRIQEVIALCNETGALNNTRSLALAEADTAKRAIADLPHSSHRDALQGIADLAVHRKQ